VAIAMLCVAVTLVDFVSEKNLRQQWNFFETSPLFLRLW
jgi:hypothetical protein